MLVSNIIEVKTPPPPMYEEEMEEQRRLEAKSKYNKELYASSELSSIHSEDEDDSNVKPVKRHRKRKRQDLKNKDHEPRDKNYSSMRSVASREELKLPEIVSKKEYFNQIKQAKSTSLSKEPIKVHSIRSLASELLVPKQETRVVLINNGIGCCN